MDDSLGGPGATLWEGATASVSTELQSFVRFTGKDKLDYSVMLQFAERSVTVRHTKPAVGGRAGGFRLAVDNAAPYRSFLEGRDGTGVVVAIPSFSSPSFKAVVVCPRDRPQNGGRGTLAATGHALDGVGFVPNASASGALRQAY